MKLNLTKQSCVDYLQKYLEIGYKASKVFSIKEGAMIAKYCRLLTGNEKDEKITQTTVYNTVFQVLELMNKNGAFTLGDASVLENIMTFIKENVLVSTKANVNATATATAKEEPKVEEDEKIKEI